MGAGIPRLVALAIVLALGVLGAAPADGGERKQKNRSGIKGVVLGSTCAGPCVDPPPPEQPYTGEVTVSVTRAADGALVRASKRNDGRFRFRLKRGLYDVTATPPGPTPTPCSPDSICPAESAVIVMPCEAGETKRVRVKRRRFTHVELHITNVCVA